MRTSIVLLAAGNSSRMGQPKQLMLFEGRPLVRHSADVARASECTEVIVVLGSSAELIRPALERSKVIIVDNAQWQDGMGTSIQAGVEVATNNNADAIILTLADLPYVTAQVLNRLMATQLATGLPIVASQYGDAVGVPALFTREFFPHLLSLKPDEGCKNIILTNAEKTIRIQCPEAEVDIDTPTDYARLGPRPEAEPTF